MSRIGKQQITVPANVTIDVKENVVHVKGPKGELTRVLHPVVSVSVENNIATVSVKDMEDKTQRSLWGTFASHVKNMVDGVTQGFEKKLEINGVGYRAEMKGKDLVLIVGYSHPVNFPLPEGITATVEKNLITITGVDKEVVGEVAAQIRKVRKPEPYKGKGIKYVDEIIRRKAGKAGKAAS